MTFGIMAPTFDTIILALDDAQDLAANQTILPPSPGEDSEYRANRWGAQAAFVQVIAGGAKWRCGGAAPADDADGHILALGDGLTVVLGLDDFWWVWPTEAGTRLAVSPADSVPTRAPLKRLSLP